MRDANPVTFDNSAGHTLFGTLHLPARFNSSLPTLVLLSPGVKMRVGPGRLYVPITDMFNDLGFKVFRFDFFGLGDSEGELHEKFLADVYNNIEVGRYVDDTVCALNWLRSRGHGERFLLGGLCGGAITALLTAEVESSVVALLSLGMTVTLASNSAVPAKYLSGGQLDMLRQGYIRRILEPRSWLRLLSFRSDYAAIWESMKRVLAKRNVSIEPAVLSKTATAVQQRGNANPLFPHAMLAFLKRGGKAFMLFGEKDRLHSEYSEKFAIPYGIHLAPYSAQVTEHVIAGANHILSMPEWRAELLFATRRWLEGCGLLVTQEN